MDSASRNGSQGELFSEICCDPDSLDASKKRLAEEASRKRKLFFDRCLSFVLIMIAACVLSYIAGYKKGSSKAGVLTEKTEDSLEKTVVIPVLDAQEKASLPVKTMPKIESLKTNKEKNDKNVVALSENIVKKDQVSAQTAVNQSLSAEKKWTVQVITYTSQERAQKEVNKLNNSADLEAFVIKSGRYHQVCINKFGSVSKAKVFLPRVRKKLGYTDAYIRKFK